MFCGGAWPCRLGRERAEVIRSYCHLHGPSLAWGVLRSVLPWKTRRDGCRPWVRGCLQVHPGPRALRGGLPGRTEAVSG